MAVAVAIRLVGLKIWHLMMVCGRDNNILLQSLLFYFFSILLFCAFFFIETHVVLLMLILAKKSLTRLNVVSGWLPAPVQVLAQAMMKRKVQ